MERTPVDSLKPLCLEIAMNRLTMLRKRHFKAVLIRAWLSVHLFLSGHLRCCEMRWKL